MRSMIGAVVLVLGVAGAGPALAQVQPPQDRINTAIARARQVGIPVVLLLSKLAEGKAKGVPMERIAVAIERREAALERAQQAMAGQQGIGNDDLSMAAEALESGVSEGVLRTIAETAPRDRRAVAIAALTQLVELGQVPEAALARVLDALQRGPDALANLPAAAGVAAGLGNGPPVTPGAAGGRGGASAGPPAGVPAPGGSSQPTRPGAQPTTPGGPPTGPGSGGGRGGA